jgi:ABC-type glycerol-3-phosphate transport system permease component
MPFGEVEAARIDGTSEFRIFLGFILPHSIRAAGTIFATVPILIVHPFLQKYFVVGLNVGSIKV